MIQNSADVIGSVKIREIVQAAARFGTPFYLYDEDSLIDRCKEVLAIPNAFGIEPRYAMKANSSKALLQVITSQGFGIDASSLNEAKRAISAGVAAGEIMLTTQEVPLGSVITELEDLMVRGMRYNACSLRQLSLIAGFAGAHSLPLSMRVHPGVGSGESTTRNTGDKYSCFGVHLSDIAEATALARREGLVIDTVHVHIGSGGDPEKWRENIDREIGFLERFFPQAVRISFGGGLKVARMPDETGADLQDLGRYARQKILAFENRTGRRLIMEVEPGTYLTANSGCTATTVIDKKQTGPEGFTFLVLDGGMEVNARPLLYGSRHPFYVVSHDGKLLSSEYGTGAKNFGRDYMVVVGRCCESGDSQSLDESGHIIPRLMAEPEVGDYVVIGGCGAYCAAMTPFNYNSHVQAPEVLLRTDGTLKLIRKTQTLDQITQNEVGL